MGLGIVGIVGIFVIALIAVPSGDGGSGGGGGGENQSASSASSGEPEAPVGEPLDVGDARWTVENAEYTESLRDTITGDPTEGNFVVVDYTFENTGSSALTVDAEFINLLDSEGNEYAISDDNLNYVPTEEDLYYEDVNPGTTTDGKAVFEVPPESLGSEFQLEVDGGTMASDFGYVNLGQIGQ